VRQLGQQLGLSDEPRVSACIIRRRAEQLDRNVAVENQVSGPIDIGHAATADHVTEQIPANQQLSLHGTGEAHGLGLLDAHRRSTTREVTARGTGSE
jgi:hypothetical protein